MSYTIEYNKQFIQSKEGITPCWLAGDNNVWDGHGRNGRRCRGWCTFHNLLGVTEADIMEDIKPSLGGYNEHWKKHGKYLDDEALIRWVKSGCRNAATVEEILAANRSKTRSIWCYLACWRGDDRFTECQVNVSTNEAFDAWLREAKSLREKLNNDGCHVYPIINFYAEDLRSPRPQPTEGKVRLKQSGLYLCDFMGETSSVWCRSITEAKVYEFDEAIVLMASRPNDIALQDACMVKVNAQQAPNVVLRFKDGSNAGRYVQKRTRSRIFLSGLAGAHRYCNAATAAQAIARMQPLIARYGTVEAIVLDKTEEEK